MTMRNAPDPVLQQAVAHHQAGRLAEAIPLYEKVVRRDSRAAGALNLLGLARFQLGDLPQAADALRRAAKIAPDIPNVDYNLGRVLQAQKRFPEAVQCYQKAVTKSPYDAEALTNLGVVLVALDRLGEAITFYQRAVAARPDHAEAWFNLGNVFKGQDRYPEALHAYEKAAALRPDAGVFSALGLVLHALDRQDEAVTFFRRAIALEPERGGLYGNMAMALEVLGEDAAAEEAYERASVLEPDSPSILFNRSVFFLSRGRFPEGWQWFHHRWSAPTLTKRDYPLPLWKGEKVQGTLFVWLEQGLGDQILFAGMLPDLRDYADNVILETDKRLVHLLSRSLPGIEVIPHKKGELSHGDAKVQVPLADIARHLQKEDQPLPSKPQLVPDTGRAAELRARLTKDGKRVIGLSWSSTNLKLGGSKSAPLAAFAPLLRMPDCRFVDLQYGDTLAERTQVEKDTGVKIDHLDDIDNTNDIDGLTALIAACDAVVTISNTTAHLAAAQGKATFILLSAGSGLLWYWLKRGETTPFYPSARLLRQSKGQPWSALMEEKAVPALAEYLVSLPANSAS